MINNHDNQTLSGATSGEQESTHSPNTNQLVDQSATEEHWNDFDPEIAAEWLRLIQQEINSQADAVTNYEVLEDGTVLIAALDGPKQLEIRINSDMREISQKVINAKQLMEAEGVNALEFDGA